MLGDGFVEDFTGQTVGKPTAALKNVAKYWNATFTKDGGGTVDGVALGISGDSVCTDACCVLCTFTLILTIILRLLYIVRRFPIYYGESIMENFQSPRYIGFILEQMTLE